MVVALELPPPQPNNVNVITRSVIPKRIAIRRLRFPPLPASTRPKRPSALKLAQSVGAIGLELGRAGVTKDAVAAAVVMVKVVDTAVLPDGVTEVGLKLAQVTVAGSVPQAKVTVPL